MSDRLDQEIRSTVVELVESSPQPHPARQALRPLSRKAPAASLSSGLVRMAAAAAAVLVVGLAGAWIGRNLIPEAADVPIVDSAPGPEPTFEPFGNEQPLGFPSGELQPDVDESTLAGDVFAVGRIPPDTNLEVFTWETTAGETCLQVVGEDFRDTSCSSEPLEGGDPSDITDGPGAFVTTRTNDAGSTDVIAVWHVPKGTSVVGIGVEGGAAWQRPKADVAAMVFDPLTARVILEAWDTEMQSLASTVFSPRQVLDPVEEGETELEGSPENLVAIEDSHPVADLWAATGTIPEFSDALDDAGYKFTCTSGGVPPYGLCLVAAEDVLVVIPIKGVAGQTVRISDSGLVQDVVVPLDQQELIGITNMQGGGVEGVIEYLGEETGSLSAPFLLGPED